MAKGLVCGCQEVSSWPDQLVRGSLCAVVAKQQAGLPLPVCPTPGPDAFPLGAKGGENKQQEGDGPGETKGTQSQDGRQEPQPTRLQMKLKLKESSKQGRSEFCEA